VIAAYHGVSTPPRRGEAAERRHKRDADGSRQELPA